MPSAPMKFTAPFLFSLTLALVGCDTTAPSSAAPAATATGAAAAEPAPIKLSAVPASFTVSKPSLDQGYGYGPDKPIKVGGADASSGPLRERMFLEQLAGPNGEVLRYQRKGSCCPFSTPNGIMGTGMLDIYEVWVGTQPVPRTLYLNMYDFEEPQAPVGFTPKPY